MSFPIQPSNEDLSPSFKLYLSHKNDLQSQIEIQIDEDIYLEDLSAIQYNKIEEDIVYYQQNVVQNKKLEVKHLRVTKNIAIVEYEIVKKVLPESLHVVQFLNTNQNKKLVVFVKQRETILKYFEQVVSHVEDYIITINDKQVDPNVKFEKFITISNQDLIIKYEAIMQEIQVRYDSKVVKTKINVNCLLSQIEEQIKNNYQIQNNYTIFWDEGLKKCANSTWFEVKKTRSLNELQFLPKAKDNINLVIMIGQSTEKMVIDIDGTVEQLVSEIKKNKCLPSLQKLDVYFGNSLLESRQKLSLLTKSSQDTLPLQIQLSEKVLIQYKNKASTEIEKQSVELSDKLSILKKSIRINNSKVIKFYDGNAELNQTLQFRQLETKPNSIIEYEIIELNPNDQYQINVQVGHRNYKYSVQYKTTVQTILQIIYDNLLIPDKLDINQYYLKLNQPKEEQKVLNDYVLQEYNKLYQVLGLSFRRQ